jgi:hypothetical protein
MIDKELQASIRPENVQRAFKAISRMIPPSCVRIFERTMKPERCRRFLIVPGLLFDFENLGR